MKQAIEVLLVFLLTVSLAVEDIVSPVISSIENSGNDYECNQEGYIEYLNSWKRIT